MVQMGSGTLSTRLRATPPSFCVLQMEDGRMTQDVVSIELSGLSVRRNYDSTMPLQRSGDGTQAPGIR